MHKLSPCFVFYFVLSLFFVIRDCILTILVDATPISFNYQYECMKANVGESDMIV